MQTVFIPLGYNTAREIPLRTNKTKAGGTVSRILSLPFSSITIYLGCGLPRSIQRPTRSISSEIKLLLGLAPNEVCIAASVTGRTVVSYTAISPLRLLSAVSFLLHFLSAPAWREMPPGNYPAFFPKEPGLSLAAIIYHQTARRGYIPPAIIPLVFPILRVIFIVIICGSIFVIVIISVIRIRNIVQLIFLVVIVFVDEIPVVIIDKIII